jgi:hypothetical protein
MPATMMIAMTLRMRRNIMPRLLGLFAAFDRDACMGLRITPLRRTVDVWIRLAPEELLIAPGRKGGVTADVVAVATR